MNMRLVLVAGLAGLAASLALAPATSAPAYALDSVDDALERFDERYKTADTQGKRNAIAEVGLKKDPRVAKNLMKKLQRERDGDVKVAICQVIGEQKMPGVAKMMLSMAKDKKNRDHPKLVAACLEGAGEADAKGNYKTILKITKKWQAKSATVASAGFRGLANHVSSKTVGDIVKQLQAIANTTTNDSAEKRAAFNGTKPVLIDILKKMTKKNIDDAKVWKDWWSNHGKRWTPPDPNEGPKDLNASDEFIDDAYGFKIVKPSRAWSFRAPTGDGSHHLTLEALDEGQRAAWIEVHVISTKGLKFNTPTAMAEDQKNKLEGRMRDIKEAKWKAKGRLGGKGTVEQSIIGRHKDFGACRLQHVYCVEGGIMYLIFTVWKSGKP
ncbi:MAG: hypothetical protein ACYTG4_12755, partial [Planctomycetota bacterium]